MDADLKKILRAVSLELRHTLEGTYDERGNFRPGDLEHRLNALGVWRDRPAKPLSELLHLPDEDKEARRVVDAYIAFRAEAGVGQGDAVAEFVRESAYTWANRLLTLRCMEARGIIDEVILQKEVYGWRSMVHNRLGRQDPALLATPDEGLFAVLSREFELRARELPGLFNPKAPAIVLRPSLATIKHCVGLLSGAVKVGSNGQATDAVFAAPDALGWAYQYWNAEEKDRVFEKVRTERDAKIQGADIIPATQLYTEPYMVKFLVQNSLGALWMGMHPDSNLADGWEYYVRDADRAPVEQKRVQAITFLDPACGSGHFHLEAFDLLYTMYEEEGELSEPESICASILNHNLYGVDIDERAVQIAQAALWMKARENAWDLEPEALTGFHHHFVATNIRLPRGKGHLEAFLRKHPEDLPLRPALETVFEGLENAHELGSLLQLEEPVEKELRFLRGKQEEAQQEGFQSALFVELDRPRQGKLPVGVESYAAWKDKVLSQLRGDFEAESEAADLTQAFFGQSAGKGLALFDVLARRYDIVVANPPYLGSKKLASLLKLTLERLYPYGRNDLMGMFLERMTQLGKTDAFIAFVSSSAFMWLQLHTDLRDYAIRNLPPQIAVHLGHYAFEELRDHVDAVLWVSDKSPQKGLWIRLVEQQQKSRSLRLAAKPNREYAHYRISPDEFEVIPGEPFLYWMIGQLSPLFKSPTLLGDRLPAKSGLQTSDIRRFVRSWWEIGSFNERWLPYVKGGETTKWVEFLTFAVDWECNGARIKTEAQRRYGSVTRTVKNQDFYFKGGLTFSLSSGKQISVRILPKGYIFDVSSPSIICEDEDANWCAAFLNSRPVAEIVDALNPTMHVTVEDISRIPITPSLLNSTLRLQEHALNAINAQQSLQNLVITSRGFSYLEFISPSDPSLREWYNALRLRVSKTHAEIAQNQTAIDEIVAGALHWDTKRDASVSDHVLDLSFAEMCQTFVDAEALSLLGYRWLRQIETEEPLPSWVDSDGIIPISSGGHGEATLYDRIRKQLSCKFPSGNTNNIEREFTDIVGEPLVEWLSGSFYLRHISQFNKRPIAWQLETTTSGRGRGNPAFSCLIYYHRLDADLLPKIRSQYIRDLRRGYETEQRTLRQLKERSADQDARLLQLDAWLDEINAFAEKLEQVSVSGFGDTPALQAQLRQYAIDDAMQSLKAVWLRRLAYIVAGGPLIDWQLRAEKTGIHPELGNWIAAAMDTLHHHCASVGAKSPQAGKLKSDPDARALAAVIGTQSAQMVKQAISLACDAWFDDLDSHVLRPALDEINDLKAQVSEQEEKLNELGAHETRLRYDAEQAIKSLKAHIKKLTGERNEQRKQAKELWEHIEGWSYPEAASWTEWLGTQPLFDQFASSDGHKSPPRTIADFTAQESRYDPDINDGVRVNIAPLQKAGLLAADVLAAKDVDKAIADRADWRADERRWCREGKLPRPGWWAVSN